MKYAFFFDGCFHHPIPFGVGVENYEHNIQHLCGEQTIVFDETKTHARLRLAGAFELPLNEIPEPVRIVPTDACMPDYDDSLDHLLIASQI